MREVQALKEAVKNLGLESPVIVNIGAGFGTSALAMREACPSAEICSIDFRSETPFGGLQNEINAFRRASLPAPVQILGSSQDQSTVEKWKSLASSHRIDLLFIDGDHSLEGVKRDIEHWVPHVREGGLVLFHDYESATWPGVSVAVQNLAKPYGLEFVSLCDTLAIYRRKG